MVVVRTEVHVTVPYYLLLAIHAGDIIKTKL